MMNSKFLNENNFYFSSKVKEFLLQGKVSVLIMSEMWKSSLRLACTVMLKCLQLNQICIYSGSKISISTGH